MMKSAFAICLVATILCVAGARDLLGDPETSCATHIFSGPSSVSNCPCSGKTSDKKRTKFDGQWKMEKFYKVGDQLYCDGHVHGSWGPKQNQKCDNYPITVPITVDYCDSRTFKPPGGSCAGWCSPPSSSNRDHGCGTLAKVPEICGCSSAEELITGAPVARRSLLGGSKHTCGSDKCSVLKLVIGGADLQIGDLDFKLDPVDLIIGGYDHGILDETVCLIGNLLDIGHPEHMPELLNIFLNGCYHPDKCSMLGSTSPVVAVDVASVFGVVLG